MIIKNKSQKIEFVFQGVKVIDTNNTSKTIKNLFLEEDCEIYIKNQLLKKENIIFIDEFTKINSFVNLNKKSKLFELILNNPLFSKLINKEVLTKIQKEININYKLDIIDINEGELNKLVNLLFESNNDKFLNISYLEFILNNILNDKKYLFVINEVSWINIKFLSNYLNTANFLIFTNDFRNYINNISVLEALAIYDNNTIFDIEDSNKMKSFIELKLLTKIDEFNWDELFNKKKSFNSLMFYLEMKKIIISE